MLYSSQATLHSWDNMTAAYLWLQIDSLKTLVSVMHHVRCFSNFAEL